MHVVHAAAADAVPALAVDLEAEDAAAVAPARGDHHRDRGAPVGGRGRDVDLAVAEQVARREGQAVEVEDQRPRRVLDDLVAAAKRDPRQAVERFAPLEPRRQLDHRVLTLAGDHGVEFGRLAQALRPGVDRVGAADDDEGAGQDPPHVRRRLARLVPAEGGRVEADDAGREGREFAEDLLAPAEGAVEEAHLVAGLAQAGRDVERPERLPVVDLGGGGAAREDLGRRPGRDHQRALHRAAPAAEQLPRRVDRRSGWRGPCSGRRNSRCARRRRGCRCAPRPSRTAAA